MSVEGEAIAKIEERLRQNGVKLPYVSFDAISDIWVYQISGQARRQVETWSEMLKELNGLVAAVEEEAKRHEISPEEVERLERVIEHHMDKGIALVREMSAKHRTPVNHLFLDNHRAKILPFFADDNKIDSKEYIDVVKGCYILEGAKNSMLHIGATYVDLQKKPWPVIEKEIRAALAKLGDK